jgi:LuxR family maltose regulon positive regulatory protein
MPAPILGTKLFIPLPRPKAVSRPRLVERLNEGLSAGRKLTLISAPAGFGKTTLVSEWVAGCGRPVAWLSLDEGENDLTGFLAYLVAALQTLALRNPRGGSGAEGSAANIGASVLRMLQSPQPPPMESILTALLNEITALPDPFLLVLDDYHVIDSKPVDEALAFLLEHLPPRMHLVITTREDPHLPLARLRARGQLTELRAADLRFSPAEAAEFLNQMMGLNLSKENIAALETRTEGWIAGLQLAALSMQGRPDAASFIQSFTGSHHFVLDYLLEEVLERQPEHVRNFLLQTAILDRLNGSLCDAVTTQDGGRGMLETLERGNLFVVPLDDRREWYRYHRLFADVLRAHLIEAQPGQVPSLHQRASAWYEQNGFSSDAIRHALAAKDFGRAAGLIELAWPAAEEGSIPPVAWLGWVKTLPDELVRVRPVLNVWYAYALLGRGDLEAAEVRFKDAEGWLKPADAMKAQPETASAETSPESSRGMIVADKEQWKSLPAAIAVGRAYIAQAFGNIPDAVRYAGRALEFPEADPFRHSQASMLLGMAHWASGNLEAADRVFADYTMKLRTAGNIPDAIGTTAVLADIRLGLGRLREAISTVEQCLNFVMVQGDPIPFDTADLYRELSDLNLEQGNLEAAARHLQRGRELGEKAEWPVLRYRLCIARARLTETQADLDGALAILDEAERLYIRSPLPDFFPTSAMKARIWVRQGRLVEALGWARERSLAVDDELSYLREFEHITLAGVLVARYKTNPADGSIHEAIGLLERLLHAAEAGGRMGSVIGILVLLALAHAAQGGIPPALVSLERALTIAEPEGYVRIFVDKGEAMRLLMEQLSRNRDHPLSGYADKLLAAFAQPAAAAKLPIIHHKSDLPDPLSERELEVLRLLRSELSGPEIARQLIVSLNTLRTHTKNIFNKLGVGNRRAAVRRAEELDLF